MYCKKSFYGFLSLVFILNFISCSNHYHTYESEWSYDESYHWHKADCEHSDIIIDKQLHLWDQITIVKKSTVRDAGEVEIRCSVCDVPTITQTVPKGFVCIPDMKLLVAITELTYVKWNKVYSWAIENGYQFQNSGYDSGIGGASNADYPVTCISWRDAIVWCNAASEYEGLIPVYWMENTKKFNTETESFIKTADENTEKAVLHPIADGYRLPTVMEWKKLAKGNSSFKYSGSDDINKVAWYKENSNHRVNAAGVLSLNSYGIRDMSGNVMELCQNITSTGNVIFMGGSWLSEPENCTVESQNSGSPNYASNTLGFRVIKNFVVTEKDN